MMFWRVTEDFLVYFKKNVPREKEENPGELKKGGVEKTIL